MICRVAPYNYFIVFATTDGRIFNYISRGVGPLKLLAEYNHLNDRKGLHPHRLQIVSWLAIREDEMEDMSLVEGGIVLFALEVKNLDSLIAELVTNEKYSDENYLKALKNIDGFDKSGNNWYQGFERELMGKHDKDFKEKFKIAIDHNFDIIINSGHRHGLDIELYKKRHAFALQVIEKM